MPVVYSRRVEDSFARFWAAYPARPDNPKAPAKAVFAKLVADGEDPEALVRAAGRFAVKCAEEGIKARFLPHARRWLNQRYFDDYLDADVPAPAEPAQPAPEHPMDWARASVTAGAWASWFARLTVTVEDGETIITAPTRLVRDRLDQDHRPLFARRFGRDWRWRIEGDPS